MAGLVEGFVLDVAIVVEGLAAVIVGYGGVVAFYRVIVQPALGRAAPGHYERARINLGRMLVTGLEFELGADILRIAVSPTWNHIAIVAAIVTLRTVLNFVVQRDIEHLQARLAGAPE